MSRFRTLRSRNPWDLARREALRRPYFVTGREEELDRGVNYFVGALEFLGARTLASCEGHARRDREGDPSHPWLSFYVLFRASTAVARRVAEVDLFTVACADRRDWRLDLSFLAGAEIAAGRGRDVRSKNAILREAATAWQRHLVRGLPL